MEKKQQIVLILYSCNTGNSDASIAAQISSAFENVTVIAPDGYIGVEEIKKVYLKV